MSTPRLILARHGETAWTLTGAHTSTTDLPLTARGRLSTTQTAATAVGPNSPINPSRISHIMHSPRLRAIQTLSLLLPTLPPHSTVLADARIREWSYGRYEGLTPSQIRHDRRQRGIDPADRSWDIWRDGSEDDPVTHARGESPAEMAERVDSVIQDVKEIQRIGFAGGREEGRRDILIVSHGHFLRAFVKRWLGYGLQEPLVMVLDPGGIVCLSYAHNNIDEPALVLGGVWGTPNEEEVEREEKREREEKANEGKALMN